MAKAPDTTTKTPAVAVRDARTGRMVTVRGVGALKARPLALEPGIDLTRPIASQVLKSGGARKASKG